MNQQLVTYIKGELEKGISKEVIKQNLLSNGWNNSDIDSNFYAVENGGSKTVLNKIILSIFIILLAGMVTALAYTGYRYYKNNSLTLGNAVLNTLSLLTDGNVESGEYELSYNVNFGEIDQNSSEMFDVNNSAQMMSQLENTDINLNYEGIIDNTNENSFEASGELNISLEKTDSNKDLFGHQELSLQYRIFPDNIFIKIDKFPSMAAFFIPINIDVNKYLNQWVALPVEMVEHTATSFTAGFNSGDSRNTPITTIDSDTKNNILYFFDESGVFEITKTKNEETKNGLPVTALYLKIDWDKLGDEIIKRSNKSEEAEIRNSISEIKKIEDIIELKVLVNNDNYIQGIESNVSLVDKNNNQFGSARFNFNIDNINNDFNIEKPNSNIDFRDLFSELNNSETISSATGGSSNIFSSDTVDRDVVDVSNEEAMLIILDVSGSMAAQLSGKPRIDIAKDSFKNILDNIPNDYLVGFRTYGNQSPVEDHNCQDTQLLYPISKLNQTSFISKLSTLIPNGYTPIELSLREAMKDFSSVDATTKKILLISDGEETCGGDPCKAIEEMINSGFDVYVDTVGVGVDSVTKSQLQCIARVGRGTYYDVNSESQFHDTLKHVWPEPLETEPYKWPEPLETEPYKWPEPIQW